MLFGQTGFSPTKLHIRDNEGEKFHNYDWLVSLAEPMPTADFIEPAPEQPTDIIIMILDNHSIQQTAANLLEKQLVSLGNLNCKIRKLQNWTPKNKEDGFFISLLEFGAPLISDLTADLFEPLQQLLTHVSNIFWVKGGGNLPDSQGDPKYGSIDGFLRALQTENSNLSTVTLWLKDSGTSVADQIKTVTALFNDRVLKDNLGQELEFVEQDGLLHVGRLMPSTSSHQDLVSRSEAKQVKTKAFKDAPPLVLQVGSPGFLDSFYFIQDEAVGKPLGPMEIEIEVKAVGVNFRDLLTALGRLDAHKTMGCECSGIVTRVGSKSRFKPGDRVGTNKLDTFRTHCRTNDYCTMKLPDDMSYTTGASVPLVFTTAYHSLVKMAHIQAGHTVLIHAGAGGAGGAAIQIAKHFNAEIFTTVGSREKKELLMKLYDIPEDHILYSRNTSFAEEIMRMTNGRGVDIVLNSLSGNSLIASWECIAPYGHFIEIGKADIYAHSDLPMYKFDKNVSFSTVDLAAMMTERPELIQESFRPVMDLISSGALQPITPLHLYKMSELEDALRYMQSGTNTGKIVIDLQPDDQVQVTLPAPIHFCCFIVPNITYRHT
jgi:NADPH:quinone reductase-like Zn-dependent oxidoreductase